MDAASLSSVLTHIPTDWIVLGVVVVILSLDAIRSGPSRATALALAAPLALVFSDALSQTAILGPIAAQMTTSYAQALLFGVMFVGLFFVLYRILYAFSSMGGALQGVISGVAATVVLAVVWTEAMQLQALWHFGPQMATIFSAAYRFWWLTGAYVALAFVRS
jgi:hypothetical protein